MTSVGSRMWRNSGTLVHIAGRMQNNVALVEKQYGSYLKIKSVYNVAIPVLGIYSKNLKAGT